MLIDWFTVVAQIINFLILVWLMKRFLYKPILDAIDAREKRIADTLSDAAAKMTEAQAQRDEFRLKTDEFEQQRAERLSQVTAEANEERQRLLDDAQKAVDELVARRKDAIRNESVSLSQAIALRTQKEVFAITRKTLADLAEASLEERMCDVFIERLQVMDDSAKTAFDKALAAADDPPLVRSAFDLPEKQQKTIQRAFEEAFDTKTSLRFQTEPELISGIELSTDGQKVAWSISDYLTSMKHSVDEFLADKAKIQEPGTSKPTTSKPTTSKPDASKPATPEPGTSKPTTSKPDASKPATPAKNVPDKSHEQEKSSQQAKSPENDSGDGKSATSDESRVKGS